MVLWRSKRNPIEKAEIPRNLLEEIEDGELIQERKDIHILLKGLILIQKGLDLIIEDNLEKVLLGEGIMQINLLEVEKPAEINRRLL